MAAPAAQAGWGAPVQFAAPGALDTLPAQIGFSSTGASAAAFGIDNVDHSAFSNAFVTLRSARGAVATPRRVPATQEVLSLTFDGPTLELLTGTSPPTFACCSTAQAIQVTSRGAFSRPRTLVSGLAGATVGQLVTLAGGSMLAAVSTATGVWAAQSVTGTRFAAARRLTAPRDVPESLAAASLGADNSVVAWTAARGSAAGPRTIFIATGSTAGGPRRARAILTVPAGHTIDELGLAPDATTATVAWIESWFDRRGAFHSEANVADLRARPRMRTLSRSGQVASGLAFDADATGDQAVVWEVCVSNGSCTLDASLRRPGGSFATPLSLGPIDPSQTPAVIVGRSGEVLAGWVWRGHPVVAVRSPRSGRFGAPRDLSSTPYATDLTLAFGPGRQAIAAWTQGTLSPSVVGDVFTGP